MKLNIPTPSSNLIEPTGGALGLNPRMGIVPRGNTAAVAEVRRAAWGV